jgi:hypothetical protein
VIIGSERQISAVEKGLNNSFGYKGSGWDIHIEGAAGELAYCKWAGIYFYPTIDTFKNGGDVGELQIRTRSEDSYDLIVREKDRDDDIFILVVGKIPKYRIVGWITGSNAKQKKWEKDYGNRNAPAYFVPQSSLNTDFTEIMK